LNLGTRSAPLPRCAEPALECGAESLEGTLGNRMARSFLEGVMQQGVGVGRDLLDDREWARRLG
jgi:hypothetical protein